MTSRPRFLLQDIWDGPRRPSGGRVSQGNSSSQIIQRNNIKINRLEAEVKALKLTIKEMNAPKKRKYYTVI